jgi:hypothetical protein
MALFASDLEVYDHLGRLLKDVAADEELRRPFERAGTVVQYQLRRPDAVLTVGAAEGEEPRVELGETSLRPEVVLRMDADVAHRFWLGRLNPAVALARGEMTARGPVSKLLEVLPLGTAIFERYRAQLEASGEESLTRA